MTDKTELDLIELPELLKYLNSPFYRTGDGVKNGNGVWLFQASCRHETEFVELGNFALKTITEIKALREEVAGLRECCDIAEMGFNRLDMRCNGVKAGTHQGGYREWSRSIWGYTSDFREARQALKDTHD